MSERRRMMMKSQLPYDAEIEYIQSTGTQYIDTGFKITGPYEMQIVISDAKKYTDKYGRICGTGNNSSTTYQYCQLYFPGTDTVIDCTNRDGSGAIGCDISGGTIIMSNPSASSWSVSQNGTAKGTASTTTTYSKASVGSVYVFAVNYCLDGSGNTKTSVATGFSKLKLYSLKFYLGGVLKKDFIPVRVGQVGYLYDKVSGTLVGNAGTGNFTIGADV